MTRLADGNSFPDRVPPGSNNPIPSHMDHRTADIEDLDLILD